MKVGRKKTDPELKKKCAAWLEENYVRWRNEQPRGEDSQVLFADSLSVDRSAFRHWISGDTIPENDNVVKIANILGDDIYDILEWEHPGLNAKLLAQKKNGSQSNLNSEISRIVHSLANMTPEERQDVEEYLHSIHKAGGKRTRVGTKEPTFER
jgi:hypothetical protein